MRESEIKAKVGNMKLDAYELKKIMELIDNAV